MLVSCDHCHYNTWWLRNNRNWSRGTLALRQSTYLACNRTQVHPQHHKTKLQKFMFSQFGIPEALKRASPKSRYSPQGCLSHRGPGDPNSLAPPHFWWLPIPRLVAVSPTSVLRWFHHLLFVSLSSLPGLPVTRPASAAWAPPGSPRVIFSF